MTSCVRDKGSSSYVAFCEAYCRPMINKPPPFNGLNARIFTVIPSKGRGFIDEGSALLKEGLKETMV